MESMIREDIENTIKKENLINEGDHIVAGVSGGPDSMCLLHILILLMQKMKLTIEVVHVNHQLRGEDADKDQQYVESYCKNNGIRCWSVIEDCKKIARSYGFTEEEAGRKIRYEAFEKVAKELVEGGVTPNKIKIAVAQNLNDQAETLIFRLMRGTGVDGLAGMDYIREDRSGFAIIRPLLDIDRKGIEAYCSENGLEPRMDDTNDKTIYARNKIRLELLPYIRENFNENITETLNRLCKVARDDKDFLWKETLATYEEVLISLVDGVCTLNRDLLRRAHSAIRNRVILKSFEKVGLYKDISHSHLEIANSLIIGEKSSGQIDFPLGFIIRINYGKVEFMSKTQIKEPIKMELKAAIFYKDDYVKKGNEAVFDMDKLAQVYDFAGGPLGLIVARNREAGDYISLKVGSKTIQDLFVDMKIPKALRDTIYMAAIGNEILWIPSGESRARYSNKYNVDEETKRILVLSMELENQEEKL